MVAKWINESSSFRQHSIRGVPPRLLRDHCCLTEESIRWPSPRLIDDEERKQLERTRRLREGLYKLNIAKPFCPLETLNLLIQDHSSQFFQNIVERGSVAILEILFAPHMTTQDFPQGLCKGPRSHHCGWHCWWWLSRPTNPDHDISRLSNAWGTHYTMLIK